MFVHLGAKRDKRWAVIKKKKEENILNHNYRHGSLVLPYFYKIWFMLFLGNVAFNKVYTQDCEEHKVLTATPNSNSNRGYTKGLSNNNPSPWKMTFNTW